MTRCRRVPLGPLPLSLSSLFFSPLGRGEGLPVDYLGIRMAGMGQAFTAVANDEHAAFANPAGIARSRNPRSRHFLHRFSPYSLEIGANSEGLKAIKGSYGRPGTWFGNTLTQANAHPDKPVELRLSTYPFALMGGKKMPTLLVGLPIVNFSKAQFVTDSNLPGTVSVSAESTSSLVLGIAGTSPQGGFTYGFVARPNFRNHFKNTYYPLDDKRFSRILLTTGSRGVLTLATGLDAGVIFTAQDLWFPSLGIAIRNIPTGCDPSYRHPYSNEPYTVCGTLRYRYLSGNKESNSANSAKVDPTEVRLGFALTPRFPLFGSILNVRLAADVFPVPIYFGDHYFSVPKLKWTQMLHAGSEIFFGNAISQEGFGFRMGSHQGLPSYGATLGLWGLHVHYASVIEDTSLPNETRKERRHLFGTSFLF